MEHADCKSHLKRLSFLYHPTDVSNKPRFPSYVTAAKMNFSNVKSSPLENETADEDAMFSHDTTAAHTTTPAPTTGNGTHNSKPKPAPDSMFTNHSSPTMVSTLAYDTTNNHSVPAATATDDEITQMLQAASNQIEQEHAAYTSTSQRILQELLTFQTVAAEVSTQLKPILESEQKESARLKDLQSEVHGSVGISVIHGKAN